MGSPADTIKQLNAAREIVLKDSALYPQVVPGVLPVIGSASHVQVRRWGADFLAETFASPVLSAEEKQKMCVGSGLLGTLRGYMSRKEELGYEEDSAVVKAAVQCAASIYPLVFRHAVSDPSDNETWSNMAAIKSSILRKMDFLPAGVKICCVKFLAIVVLVQTPGLIADPRRPEQNEVSLALVPRDHDVLRVGNLEAEAIGLLDRLLSVLQEEGHPALLVTATINALASLVHRRVSVSNKILGVATTFNPTKLIVKPVSGKDGVTIKSTTRTTISFLLNVLKRNPQHAMGARIQQHVERLRHSLGEAFADANQLKRPAPEEPVDGLDDAKRQRLAAHVTNGSTPQQRPTATKQSFSLPPGPVTAAQLFTLTDNSLATNFNAATLPPQLVAQLVPALLSSVDVTQLDAAINIVRARYLEVTSRPPATSHHERLVTDDDDDYDPEAIYADDPTRAMGTASEVDPDINIGPFSLPWPRPLSGEDLEEHCRDVIYALFKTLREKDREVKEKGVKPRVERKGWNALGQPIHTRDGWGIMVIRIATRATFALDDLVEKLTKEHQEEETAKRAYEVEAAENEGEADNAQEERKADGFVVMGETKAIKSEGENDAANEEIEVRTAKRKDVQEAARRERCFVMADGIRNALFDFVMEDFRRLLSFAMIWLYDEWFTERELHQYRGTDKNVPKDLDLTPTTNHWTLKILDAIIPYLDTKDKNLLIRFYSEMPALDQRAIDLLLKVADDPERVNMVVHCLLYLIMYRPPAKQLCLDAMEKLWRENPEAKKPAEKFLAKYRPEVISSDASAGVNGDLSAKAKAEASTDVKMEGGEE